MKEKQIRFLVMYFMGLVFCSAIVISFIRYIVFKDFVSVEPESEEMIELEMPEEEVITE